MNIEAGAPPDAPVVLDDAVATTSEKNKLDSFVENGKLFLYFATAKLEMSQWVMGQMSH